MYWFAAQQTGTAKLAIFSKFLKESAVARVNENKIPTKNVFNRHYFVKEGNL